MCVNEPDDKGVISEIKLCENNKLMLSILKTFPFDPQT